MKKFLSWIVLLVFVLTACGPSAAPMPEVSLPLVTTTPLPAPTQPATSTPIPPTEPPAPTPEPMPTSLPTAVPAIPTPQGGATGLLLVNDQCQAETATTLCQIYTYNLRSHKTSLLLEGYSPVGVSPDGARIAVERTDDSAKTDLFVVDLAKPDQPVLLAQNVRAGQSAWFPGTDWLGFIAQKDEIPQVFIVHPDGGSLTQATNSPTGAVTLEPAFNDGVFWGEGRDGQVDVFKWTRLDGNESVITNFAAVSANGNTLIASSLDQSSDCYGCTYDVSNLITGETSQVVLSKPSPDMELGFVGIQPLSDGLWLVKQPGGSSAEAKYWLYSKDGQPLLDFAALPHDHAPLPENSGKMNYFRVIGGDEGDLSGQRLSPDTNWLVIQHWSGEQASFEITYYLLNVATFEIQKLPEISYVKNGATEEGIFSRGVLWIELP